jgi:uncharacterized protein (TIGR03435 family)
MYKRAAFAIAPLLAIVCLPHDLGAIPTSKAQSQSLSFEVASIRPATPGDTSGKFATMQSAHQFTVRNYSAKDLISFAYNLPPRLITGGPSWAEIDKYNILAGTAGEARPKLDEQMSMMRTLLADRFKLTFHTESKDLPVYVLTVAKGGIKFGESANPNGQPNLVSVGRPTGITLPARNATMGQFASTLQRGILDRPVVDKTNLTAKYDFDLEWLYDDTQFGGNLPPPTPQNVPKPDLFSALQQQLGLRLDSSREFVDVIVIDRVEKPTEN